MQLKLEIVIKVKALMSSTTGLIHYANVDGALSLV